MAQRSKFIGAPSRNEFWAPQEGVYMGGNSQIAGQSPITPSESATASFDSLMDVKSAFALLLTRVTELFIRFVDYKNKGKVIL